MGMRQKNIVPEDGIRAYQQSGLTKNQKLLIVGSVIGLLLLFSLGAFLIVNKRKIEKLEAEKNKPAEVTYVNLLYDTINGMSSYDFSGTINTPDFLQYCPEVMTTMGAGYSSYKFSGYVNNAEIGCELDGEMDGQEPVYITNTISNEDGVFVNVSNYYQTDDTLVSFENAGNLFIQNMDSSEYVQLEKGSLDGMYYLRDYFLTVIDNIKQSNVELAKNQAEINSYSARFPSSVFTTNHPNMISNLFTSSDEPVLSTFTTGGEESGTWTLNISFQQGDTVITIQLQEFTEQRDKTNVYAVSMDTLNTAMDHVRAGKAENDVAVQQALEDAAKEETEEDETTEESTEEQATEQESE